MMQTRALVLMSMKDTVKKLIWRMMRSLPAHFKKNYQKSHLQKHLVLQTHKNRNSRQLSFHRIGMGSSLQRATSQLDVDRIGTSGQSEAIYINIQDFGEPPELNQECILDGEVGKRLNQMVSVPHVPRINSQIPTADDAESDHQRLLDRLKVYDLVELKMKGDGNCQFRALSDQLYHSTDNHSYVRKEIVKQLKSYPELYNGYVPMPYAEYLKKMSRNGEWGDHVTLQAAADTYGVKIFVLTSFKNTCYIEILPRIEKSSRVICLSFWAEVHYNSIYPEGEFPVANMRKKK